MGINWQILVINLVVGVVIAVISARVTVHFALKRFYSEKWWERKVEAYTSIIESLHHIRNHADHNLIFSMANKELPEEAEEELTKKMQNALAELRKRLDIGTFVVSEEAMDVMRSFMNELDASTKTNNWIEHLNFKLAAVGRCLVVMRRIARTDLSLKL